MLGARENRLKVHRLPNGPGLDILRVEGDPERLPIHAELSWLNRQTGQPTGVPPPRCLGHELDARKVAERFEIKRKVASASRYARLEHPQLPPSHGGEHVAQPAALTDRHVLVIGDRF